MELSTKLRLKVFVIPPGKFFDPARKQNLLIINTGYNYIYTLRSHLDGHLSNYYQFHYSYSLSKHISSWKNPCKSSLAWKEDDCKLGQERLIIAMRQLQAAPKFVFSV